MHGGLVMRPSSLGQVEGGLKVTGCWRQGILLRNPGLADQECWLQGFPLHRGCSQHFVGPTPLPVPGHPHTVCSPQQEEALTSVGAGVAPPGWVLTSYAFAKHRRNRGLAQQHAFVLHCTECTLSTFYKRRKKYTNPLTTNTILKCFLQSSYLHLLWTMRCPNGNFLFTLSELFNTQKKIGFSNSISPSTLILPCPNKKARGLSSDRPGIQPFRRII